MYAIFSDPDPEERKHLVAGINGIDQLEVAWYESHGMNRIQFLRQKTDLQMGRHAKPDGNSVADILKPFLLAGTFLASVADLAESHSDRL